MTKASNVKIQYARYKKAQKEKMKKLDRKFGILSFSAWKTMENKKKEKK